MQINEQHSLSHSTALSFGPEWMRPKPRADDFSGNAWGQEAFSSKTLYSTDQLLEIWKTLQTKLQDQGFEDKYRSLQPIRELVSQVERDRAFQSQNASNTSASNGKKKNDIELSEKLSEIDSWAKKEGNGLDFASILSNVAKQQESPFNRSIQLQRENTSSSLSSFNSPLMAPHGLHAFSQPQPLLQPEQINWYYLDPNGKEQGPFNGLEMQNWYNLNYLSPDLQIRRDGEFSFTLLREFATRVGDTIQPFLISLQSLKPLQAPVVPQQQQQQQQQHQQFNPFDQQIPGLFDQSSSFIQPQSQLSQFQSSANTWNMNNSGRNSPWTQPVQPQTGLGSDYMQTNFNVFDQQQQHQQSVEDDLFSQIQNQVLTGVLNEGTNTSTKKEIAPEVVPQVQESAKEPVAQPVAQQPIPQPKETKAAPQKQTKAPVPAPAPTPAPVTKSEKKSKPKVTTASEVKAAKPESRMAPPAPWAAQTSTYTSPQMTLDQIQKLEGQEKIRQQKLRAEKAAQMLASTEKSLREQELLFNAKQQGLPSTSSWVTSNTVETPTKTLADIQREEAQLAAMAKQASQAQQPQTNAPSKSSFASIANSSATSPGSAWTVVTSKKPQNTHTQQQAPVIHSTMKQATPDMLRSVSATTTPVVNTTASTSSRGVSPRQEFLAWCRSTLKLNKSVSVNDVLQIMLMLPIGQESSEIIADTVYSNSSTMDGRRFAQDFMKRRRAVEAVVNDGLSWNDALHISVTDDDDGWDFQVVKKKGKKRN